MALVGLVRGNLGGILGSCSSGLVSLLGMGNVMTGILSSTNLYLADISGCFWLFLVVFGNNLGCL